MSRSTLWRVANIVVWAWCLSAVGSARQASPTFSIEDVTVAEGDAGTSVATFRVVRRNPNNVESRVHFLTADGSASSASTTHSSGALLTIPSSGPAGPYPATVSVSGLAGTVRHLAVRLDNLTHPFPADLDVLLVGPGGQRAMILSDMGGSDDVANVTFVLQDGAPTPPTPLVAGTFAPTDFSPGETLPAPAPAGPYGASLAIFNGTNPNGIWQLFVNDDLAPDGGSLSGFSLLITTSGGGGDYVPGAGLLTFPPSVPARQVQVVIAGDGVIEPDEAFSVGLLAPFNGVIAAGTGIGTILNDDAVTTTQPPTGLRVSSMAGNLVTFRWNAPLVGPVPTGYLLEGGVTPGGVLATVPTGTAAPTFSLAVPAGSFYVRFRALSAAGVSAPSNEVLMHVGVPVLPSAPADLVGMVATSRLALAWRNTFTGGAPTALVLDVAGPVNASLPLGIADTFAFNSVPPGTYSFRVRGVNAAGSSPPSNPVTLTFPGACAQPQPPANFVAYRVGNVLSALWDAPDIGTAPTGYVINVSGAVTGSLPLPGKGVSAAVGPGTYVLSVQAANFCGAGPATSTQTVHVP